jgi:mannose-1-phosphate guanylyltransferase/mannose-6-phosphate isomerase
MKKIQIVILCGGSGKRLWPISRKAQPKQFVSLIDGKSLLQQTLERLASRNTREYFLNNGYLLSDKPICIGSEMHRFQIQDDAHSIDIPIQCIYEPFSRNTAPAMAVVSCFKEQDESELLVFCPSDHYIEDRESYLQSLLVGFDAVKDEEIITLGVKPHFASTAYGYVEVKNVESDGDVFPVKRFIEKPPEQLASQLIKKKNIFWNAGSFITRVGNLQNTLLKLRPDILGHAKQSLQKAKVIDDGVFLNKDIFKDCPAESIDYAILEKYDNLKLVELRAKWSDVGSWNSLADLFKADGENNKTNADQSFFFESKNSFIYSSSLRPIVAVGINQVTIVETPDAILISDSRKSESIKNVVKELEKRDIVQAENHRKVNRPWGSFDSIDAGERFQVKRIFVKPGGRLSLQRHEKRAEHWVVIKGTAKVTRGSDVFILKENESTFIPKGVVHRLENLAATSLEIIEVQTGTYFGEDDIFRLEDEYGRKE